MKLRRHSSRIIELLPVLLVVTAAGCGSSSARNEPPVADAGPDQTIMLGERVVLDGSGSYDPDGDSLVFAWSITVAPDGAGAVLSSTTGSTVELAPDVAGIWIVTLVVSDGSLSSAPDTARITVLSGDCGNGKVEGGEDCDPGPPRSDNCCDPETCRWVQEGGQDPQGTCVGGGTCEIRYCDGSGGCLAEYAMSGTPCGDGTDSECDRPDTCDGMGNCLSNYEQQGAPCGDQGVPCHLDDFCDGRGNCQDSGLVADGTTCDDGLFCTTGDSCRAGVCTGDPNRCDDGNPCTADSCDEAADSCVNTPLADGTPCDDGAWCTVGESCAGGVCGGGLPRDCSDGNDCTLDVCNESADSCEHPLVQDGTACDDGAWCTVGEVCTNGACGGGTARDCTDGNECTADACNEEARRCDNVPVVDGTDCTDDGLFCNGTERCVSGQCTSSGNPCSNPADCDEQNDRCGACGDGVVNAAAGEQCDPGSPQADNCCDPASCTWVADGLPDPQVACAGASGDCQADVCDGAGGCKVVNIPPGSPCGSQFDTDCDNPDSCDGSGNCLDNLEPDGTPCTDDGLFCSGAERCMSGQCSSSGNPCGNPAYCDEQNDRCGYCGDGVVTAGAGEQCDSGSPQNDNCCDPSTCTWVADGLADPQGACNLASGACQADVCDGSGGCRVENLPQGTACPDADFCTDDVCDGRGNCTHLPASDPSSDPNWQCIETACDGLDNDCDGCTDEGCSAGTVAEVRVIPYSDGPGLRRISGNAQLGPAGRQLPYPLVVQLNDSNGQPVPCERVSFTVEPAGQVCFGKGGTYNASGQTTDPETIRVCNDIEGGSFPAGSVAYTDSNGQASVHFVLPEATGTVAISATAEVTGEKVFFLASSVARLSSSISLPPPSPVENPALGPLDVTVRNVDSSRSFMFDKSNYTLTIDGLSSSAGSTNGVASAPIAAGGTLTISGTQFTDSEPVAGSCGGAPQNGYPRVWVGGVEVTPSSVTDTEIVVPIPEGLPGAASVIVDDGTTTTFKAGTGCVPSRADAMANFWRVGPGGPPVYLHAETGSLGGGTLLVKVEALDGCGNPLPLAGRTVTVWTENPDGSSPSTAVQASNPDGMGIVSVAALSGGESRAALVAADVDGITSRNDGKAVVVPVSRIDAASFDDSGIGNDDGVNSIIFRGGQEGGSSSETERLNPAFRLQSITVDTYDLNWMCTIGLVPACECPAAGAALTNTCGQVFETEGHLACATVTGEGDIINMHPDIGDGEASMAGSAVLGIFGGDSGVQSSGGMFAVVSAQAQYFLPGAPDGYQYGVQNVEGSLLTGRIVRPSGQQVLDLMSNGLMLYDDLGDSDQSNDEIREIIFRLIISRALP